MKRYLIFALLGPLLGGFWLLLTTTVMAGYWSHPPSFSQTEKVVAVFATTLQYSYLFGILPALMMGAVDDILFHVKRINWGVRVLIVGDSLSLTVAVGLARYAQQYGVDLGGRSHTGCGVAGTLSSSPAMAAFTIARVYFRLMRSPSSAEPPTQPVFTR